MDWTLAIARNCEALQRIVAALIALAGVVNGKFQKTLPRPIYRTILRILRPAESAVRRLIIIAAFGLKILPRAAQLAPMNVIVGTGTARLPAFRLIDPLKRISTITLPLDEGFAENLWIDGDDEDKADVEVDFGGLPRISVPGHIDPVFTVPTISLPKHLADTRHIARRLLALKRALDNLPREARRLARWQSKRPLVFQQSRPARVSPFRPGLPPGFRKRSIHEVDGILRECHALMRDRLSGPDTS